MRLLWPTNPSTSWRRSQHEVPSEYGHLAQSSDPLILKEVKDEEILCLRRSASCLLYDRPNGDSLRTGANFNIRAANCYSHTTNGDTGAPNRHLHANLYPYAVSNPRANPDSDIYSDTANADSYNLTAHTDILDHYRSI